MPKNRMNIDNKGIIDLNASELCFEKGEDRDQIMIFAKIGSVSAYNLADHKPKIYKAIKEYADEHHPDFLVVIYPEGYDFALLYDEHCEEDGEKDEAYTLFLGKKGLKVEGGGEITLDTIEEGMENVEETDEITVYKEEPGNLRETIVAQSTIMAEKKLHRDPHILD